MPFRICLHVAVHDLVRSQARTRGEDAKGLFHLVLRQASQRYQPLEDSGSAVVPDYQSEFPGGHATSDVFVHRRTRVLLPGSGGMNC